MNQRYIYSLVFLLLSLSGISQMYILNEDFTGTSGTNPPAGWSNIVIEGTGTDNWHFDNPGQRLLNFPVLAPFAIFDAEAVSANGQPEEVALETPLFDASSSNFILLQFHQYFDPGSGANGYVMAYDGNEWTEVTSFSSLTANPSTEVVDLSQVVGGITNARLRFIWSGNGSGFWAVDNIRIYASQPLDGGVVSIDSPTSPVDPGVQDVVITLGNFGYNTITTTTINWTVNGEAQPPFAWEGSMGFGQTIGGVAIGSYNFQTPVDLKVWQSDPNGGNDPNPYNDTVTKRVEAALCGTYTIGGNNPDFESFSEVATTLNSAGITCPVTFVVRDGTYYEQFILGEIPGTSETNTITFESENGNSQEAVIKISPGALKYEPMILMNGTSYVTFRNLGLYTGSEVSFANNAVEIDGAHDIDFEGCFFQVRNQFDFGLSIYGGSSVVSVLNCGFEGISGRAGAISVEDELTGDMEISGNEFLGAVDWGYNTVWIQYGASDIYIEDNNFERCYRAVLLEGVENVIFRGNILEDCNYGIVVDNYSESVEVSANRFLGIKSHQNVPEGTSAVGIFSSSMISIHNNFIQTAGEGVTRGISIDEDAFGCQVHYNSVNITNTDGQALSTGFYIREVSQVTARNNIFSVLYAGRPVGIDAASTQLDLDRNDYYSFDGTVGYFAGNRYLTLSLWSAATGMDASSLAVPPFFTSLTDLSMNQVLLNDIAEPVLGINDDIDGDPRNPVTPDMGAKEYNPCTNDAGINAVVSPQNPLAGGNQDVTVLLQNQGASALTSAQVNWTVNGQLQATFPWSGNLGVKENTEVSIGSYNFEPGILYTIEAWTSAPNGTSDCNHANDTIRSPELTVPLCGTYTIGGLSPDFQTFSEVAVILNLAGISCPVTFVVRDGIYEEMFTLREISGTSETNTITFRSESGDSTLSVIQIPIDAEKFETMLYLLGTSYVRFQDLGFVTGASSGYNNYVFVLENADHIEIEGCNFGIKKEADLAMEARDGSHDILFLNNNIHCFTSRALGLIISGETTRDLTISGNHIIGATNFNMNTIRIEDGASSINLTGNEIINCFRAISISKASDITVSGNLFANDNYGVSCSDVSSNIEIHSNRFMDMVNSPDIPAGTSAVQIQNISNSRVYNNFIHTTGNGPTKAISIQNTNNCGVYFNSINVTNTDPQGQGRGIYLKSNNQVTVRNNIFNVWTIGTPVYMEGVHTEPDIDRNDYYSSTGLIGILDGNNYYDLEAWSAALGMDANSLSAPPFYSSETDLGINQALLNNAGLPVAGIPVDIDGTPRDPQFPDLGAREYSPCANDAGINIILDPQNPLAGGPEDVAVQLQNQGANILSSVEIRWAVNAAVQTAFEWNGSLAPGANEEVIIGTYDFQLGNVFRLEAWTSDPNGSVDCNVVNDTAMALELASPLCGTYTIGESGADFPSLARAAEVLSQAGIGCPVVFLVKEGVYYEQFVLESVQGSSETNTITFAPEIEGSDALEIRISPDALKFESMIRLKGTENVHLHGLRFFTGSEASDANSVIRMEGAADISVNGCYFETLNDNDFGIILEEGTHEVNIEKNHFECVHIRSGAMDMSDEQTGRIKIRENTIIGSALWGTSVLRIGGYVNQVEIAGNRIENCYRAIYAVGADSLQIMNNFIKNVNEGIYIDNQCSGVEIYANYLVNVSSHQNAPEGTNGIYAVNSGGISVINNFVHTTGTGPSKGITLLGMDTCTLWFNTVHVTNSDAQAKSRGIYLHDVELLYGRNNLLSVKSLGVPLELDQDVEEVALDYNNYYQPSGIIGRIEGMTYYSLSQWGQTINGDANSKVVNPFFKADTVPLPFQRALNGAGIPIPGILYDIEGKLRFSQAPDIGCLEFFVDYGVLDLLSPTLECFHPEVDTVIVHIRQYGDVPFNDLKVAYQMNDGQVHTDTIPGPHIEDVIHSFGTTENLTTYGDYLFKIWLINTLDDNINNDTLYAWRHSKPSPEPSIAYDNFCTGPKVFFFGDATVPQPHFIDGYEWLFGDGETSTEQNPVHTYAEPGNYEVELRAYSDAGCYGSIIQSIFINPDFIPLTLNYDVQNETCLFDGTGSIEVMLSGGYPPVNITFNGEQTTDTLFTGLNTGQYIIQATDAENCSLSDTILITSEIFMNPHIMAEPVSGNAPLTVSFDFTAGNYADWLWHFTEEDTDTSHSPVYTFTEYGNHVVLLDVISGHPHYCVETAAVEIFVDVIVTIEANNVFTPNKDGVNDFFEIKTTSIRELEAKIYNIWGNKVYAIEDVGGKWDGTTTGGANAPDGTYFWTLVAVGSDNRTYTREGSVLLLRHAAEAVPNPVRDRVQVKIYDSLDPPIEVKVFSAFGQQVRHEVVSDTENIVLDLSNLPGGIYFIKVTDGKGDYFVRIIKN